MADQLDVLLDEMSDLEVKVTEAEELVATHPEYVMEAIELLFVLEWTRIRAVKLARQRCRARKPKG